MATISAILRVPVSTPRRNHHLIQLAQRLDACGFLIEDIEQASGRVDASVLIRTDGPVSEEQDALREIQTRAIGIDYDEIVLVRDLCDMDEQDSPCCLAYRQPIF